MVAGAAVFAALLAGPWHWWHLNVLFDDWIFSREYIRSGNSIARAKAGPVGREMLSRRPTALMQTNC